MYKVGYTTGTFDLPHYGHFELLKKCKSFCDKLIVGLVSDNLGIRQKRKPILSYEHRKAILENSKWVDHVVIFEGSTKQIDYEKMKFDVLFISDEYFKIDEYENFKDTPIYYFPRTSSVSTSDIFKGIVKRVVDESELFSSGTGGDIMKFRWKKEESYIVKPINLSLQEENTTANSWLLPIPPPRNWKLIGEKEEDLPFLAGVNPNREISISHVLVGKPWFLVEDIVTKIKDQSLNIKVDKERLSDTINSSRKFGRKIVWLVQKDGGLTLDKFFKENNADEEMKSRFYIIVRTLIDEMRKLGVLHMDLHVHNIVVKNNQVAFIDFGWCMHRSFEMCTVERKYYETKLEENFDLKHFRESLVVMGVEEEIPPCLL